MCSYLVKGYFHDFGIMNFFSENAFNNGIFASAYLVSSVVVSPYNVGNGYFSFYLMLLRALFETAHAHFHRSVTTEIIPLPFLLPFVSASCQDSIRVDCFCPLRKTTCYL
jgi:hypothetical protein